MKMNLLSSLAVALLVSSCAGAGGQKVAISKAGDSKLSCKQLATEQTKVDDIITASQSSVAGDAAVAVGQQAALHHGAASIPYLGSAMSIFNSTRQTSKAQSDEVLKSAESRKAVLSALASSKGC